MYLIQIMTCMNLEPIVSMIFKSFQDPHPRVRWATINAIPHLFQHWTINGLLLYLIVDGSNLPCKYVRYTSILYLKQVLVHCIVSLIANLFNVLRKGC